MSDVQRVLVVGGGIGGLSTTIALRMDGLDVDVIEKNPAWDVYGVGIIQPPNALRALDVIGVARECVDQGWPIIGSTAFLADGQTQIADDEMPAVVPGLPPGNGITRKRLHAILQRHTLDSGADVRTGVTVTTLADRSDGVSVEFSDGERRDYDLVVAADGIDSQKPSTKFWRSSPGPAKRRATRLCSRRFSRSTALRRQTAIARRCTMGFSMAARRPHQPRISNRAGPQCLLWPAAKDLRYDFSDPTQPMMDDSHPMPGFRSCPIR